MRAIVPIIIMAAAFLISWGVLAAVAALFGVGWAKALAFGSFFITLIALAAS